MRRERRLKKLLTSQETGSYDKHVAVGRILTKIRVLTYVPICRHIDNVRAVYSRGTVSLTAT